MTTVFAEPTDFAPPVRDAGGDNEVPRDSKGRPRIIIFCETCAQSGRVPSEKRPAPATVQCPKCKGAGKYERSYTRTTTFIDVIEDKSSLEAWQMRMVLVGAAIKPSLLDEVEDLHIRFRAYEAEIIALHGNYSAEAVTRLEEIEAKKKEIKDDLNRRAQIAKTTSGAEDKADKGTHLHGLSELKDLKQDLPSGISFADIVDMDAYTRATTILSIVHMEHLVVHDVYSIGGTPDRVSKLDEEAFQAAFPEMWEKFGGLVAPDGTVILPGELMITDLKTGTVDYGALKMAMQLAIYSRSKLYFFETGERQEIENLNQRWGIIMHLPAGRGECTLYWVDLTLGWEAVEVARQVRSLRNRGKSALKVLVNASGVPSSVKL